MKENKFIFNELSLEEFQTFIDKRPEKNFFQTIYMKNKLEKEGKEVYLVGVKKKNKVVAATLVTSKEKTFLNKKTYEAYKGFVMDYNNLELLSFFTKEITNFLKNKNGFRLLIDPYIQNISRNSDAEIIDGIDNRHIKKWLYNLGYQEISGEQVKWCYVLPINNQNEQELFQKFKNNTRNYINRTISKYCLQIRTLKKEELNEFKKITSSTCQRKEFCDKPLSYYENMYDAFGKYVTFKICELDCNVYLKKLNQEQQEIEQKITNTSSSASSDRKKESLKKELQTIKEKKKEIQKLKQTKGIKIPLSCGMFILYGDEIVYLFSGSYKEYMSFCGQYRLQWEMIKYAAQNNYKRYNFYGIQDVFNKEGKDYGIYEFKKGFNGQVEELLGTFEIGFGNTYNLYKKIQTIKNIFHKLNKK